MRTERLFAALIVAAACSTQAPSPKRLTDASATADAAPVAPERMLSADPTPSIPDATLRDPFEPGPLAGFPPPRPLSEFCYPYEFTLDELRLVGVVTGLDEPRAMFVDPNGKGWIMTPGRCVGRGDDSSNGAGAWRIDRIRGSDVVLVRESFGWEEGPPVTRVLALHRDEAI